MVNDVAAAAFFKSTVTYCHRAMTISHNKDPYIPL